MNILFFCFLIALCITAAKYGVDLSVPTTSEVWDCLKSSFNITYAIIRTYRNIGEVDTNATNSINTAAASGFNNSLDGYIFPCIQSSQYSKFYNYSCPSPSQQVDDLLNYLVNNSITFDGAVNATTESLGANTVTLGCLWIDIEDEVPATYYDPNPSVNVDFVSQLIDYLQSKNISVGIYTTKTYWLNIMGNVEKFGYLPLWYPRYDGINNMDFFVPFADFKSVQIKQTGGNVGYCNLTQIDSDYMN